jgi:MFS transporter, ACS family, D-galactonate transporter
MSVAPASPVAANQPGRVNRQRSILLGLLVVSICINYIDRANLSAAAEGLSHELSLDPKQLGLLFSSFFFSYAAFQIPSGWLIDRVNVYRVYAAGYFVWSAATAMTGLAGSFNLIFGLRLLLGMAEACAYPSYSKIIASSFSEQQRGLPNALIDAGSKIGPALGLLVGGSIVAMYGWRSMFLSIGGASLFWLIPWCIAIRNERVRECTVEEGPCPGLLEIFAQRSAWGTFIGLLGANYAWYFMLTWIPSYLVRERHFSVALMSTVGSIPFWGVAASSIFSGWLSDRLIRRGGSVTRVRKTFAVAGLAVSTLLMPAAIVDSQLLAVVLLTAACLSYGLFSSNVWAITQTLAGPSAAGKWTGIQNTFGNVSGIVAPYVTGWIVAETHSFFWAFVLVCGALLASAGSYFFVVGQLSPVRWRSLG